MHDFANILKTTKLYTVKGLISCYLNSISILKMKGEQWGVLVEHANSVDPTERRDSLSIRPRNLHA